MADFPKGRLPLAATTKDHNDEHVDLPAFGTRNSAGKTSASNQPRCGRVPRKDFMTAATGWKLLAFGWKPYHSVVWKVGPRIPALP